MKHLIDMLNFAYRELLDAKQEDTYDDDSQADHGDGMYCGRVEAYKKVIKECAKNIQEEV